MKKIKEILGLDKKKNSIINKRNFEEEIKGITENKILSKFEIIDTINKIEENILETNDDFLFACHDDVVRLIYSYRIYSRFESLEKIEGKDFVKVFNKMDETIRFCLEKFDFEQHILDFYHVLSPEKYEYVNSDGRLYGYDRKSQLLCWLTDTCFIDHETNIVLADKYETITCKEILVSDWEESKETAIELFEYEMKSKTLYLRNFLNRQSK